MRKIVGEEKIFERGYRERYQTENGHAGVARAFGEQRPAGDDPCDSGDEGVHRRQKSEQKCKRTENIHEFPLRFQLLFEIAGAPTSWSDRVGCTGRRPGVA